MATKRDMMSNLRLIAMAAVEDPSVEDWLRSLYRWFSKTFHTPLPDVEKLPADYIILHYFENKYEDMNAQQRKEEIENILLTPEEKEDLENQRDMADENFFKEAQEEAEKEEAVRQARLEEQKALLRGGQPLKKEVQQVIALPPDPDEVKIEHVEDAEWDKLMED